MCRSRLISVFGVVLLVWAGSALSDTITVDDDGPADFNNIQAAINDTNDGDEVVISPGTYSGDGNRDIDFGGRAITVRSTDPNDSAVVAATVIDCNGTFDEPHRGFTFNSGEARDSVVSGFTIIHGYGRLRQIHFPPSPPPPAGTYYYSLGGGILCEDASPVISKCVFRDNHVGGPHEFCRTCYYGRGGGIYCGEASSPLIIGCVFEGNGSESDGGAVYIGSEDTVTIRDCTFLGNDAEYGGGVYCAQGYPRVDSSFFKGNTAIVGSALYCKESIVTAASCVFSGNRASFGGTVFCKNGELEILNSNIVGNSAKYGGAVYCYDYGDVVIKNSVLWNNRAIHGHEIALRPYSYCGGNIWPPPPDGCIYHPCSATVLYSDIEDSNDAFYVGTKCHIYLGPGNIEGQPGFIEDGRWVDVNDQNVPVERDDPNAFWIDGDYHLLPDSPCIDAGDPNYVAEPNETDIDGEPRISADRIDIGAYEFIPRVECEMRFMPKIMVRSGPLRSVMAILVLPEGITKEQVDNDDPLVLRPGEITASSQYVFEWPPWRPEQTIAMAFFNKTELTDAVTDNGKVELQVFGKLTNGDQFSGKDEVWIIGRDIRCMTGFAAHWLQDDCTDPDWCEGFDLNHDGIVNFLDFAMTDGCSLQADED